MRYLAIARYRFLTTIRAAAWSFALSLLAALLFILGTGILFIPERAFFWSADELLPRAAALFTASYFVHTLILIVAFNTFGAVRNDPSAKGNLLDTAPALPRHRFAGDALGIFASVMSIHLCTLPLLALSLCLSPYPMRYFFIPELLIVALLVIGSAGASYKLHTSPVNWGGKSTTGRTGALLGVFFFMILAVTGRLKDLFETAVRAMVQPTPQGFSQIADAVDDPFLLAILMLLVYGGFLLFYAVRSIRLLQPR